MAAHHRSWAWRRTLRTLLKRTPTPKYRRWGPLKTRSLTSALFIHGMNTGWKRMAKFQAPIDEQRFGLEPQRLVLHGTPAAVVLNRNRPTNRPVRLARSQGYVTPANVAL